MVTNLIFLIKEHFRTPNSNSCCLHSYLVIIYLVVDIMFSLRNSFINCLKPVTKEYQNSKRSINDLFFNF